jgi:hypothetical protein
MAVSHHTRTAIGKTFVTHGGQKRIGFRLDSLRQKPARSIA